jgi:predicted DNA-binding protein (MmcQ/YjbR family)
MARIATARKTLVAHALAHPGARIDHPWGEDVAKVGKKIFVFFGLQGPEFFVGVKLPRSLPFAKKEPFVTKFGYGLDASGWVAARFVKGDDVPVDLLRGWIDESFAAIAPKRTTRARRLTRRAGDAPLPRARVPHRVRSARSTTPSLPR